SATTPQPTLPDHDTPIPYLFHSPSTQHPPRQARNQPPKPSKQANKPSLPQFQKAQAQPPPNQNIIAPLIITTNHLPHLIPHPS
ncbi:hypothetical protein L873DRAFT_1807666, partial [Choiromyces venosus 120613-1]